MKFIKILVSLILGLMVFVIIRTAAYQSTPDGDAILGRWRATDKDLTVEIYKAGDVYNARIISFTDHHNNTPASERMDEKNPNAALRKRKIIGMDVLYNLHYNAGKKEWNDGTIYDVKSGDEYSAFAEVLPNGQLSVRAYKGISMFGKTLNFRR